MSTGEAAMLTKAASGADILLTQSILAKPGRPGSDELSKGARDSIRLPNAYFTGYHQHLQLMTTPDGRDSGCLAVWSLLRRGLEPQQIQDALLSEASFREDDVLASAQASLEELRRRESTDGVDIPLHGYLEDQWRRQILFHTANHPKRSVLLYVCNRILEQMATRGFLPIDIAFIKDGPDLDHIFSSIDFMDHLLLPGVACALGLTENAATSSARIRFRKRFTLAGTSPTKAVSIFEQAEAQRDWLRRDEWGTGIAANDHAARLVPQVRLNSSTQHTDA